MRRLVSAILISAMFVTVCEAQKCEKYFKNVKRAKKSESSVFDHKETLTTKWIMFYNQGAREVFMQFTNQGGTDKLVIMQRTKVNLQFKQPLNLGTEIQIALVFENKKNYIIKFDANENKMGERSESYHMSKNSIVIGDELSQMLKENLMLNVEIKNPFNNNLSNTKVLSEKAERGEKIKLVYACFMKSKS